jgi:glycosyltransferase involved in cell wall biosynthesis
VRVALAYQYFALTGSLERERVMLAEALRDRGIEVHCYSDPRGRFELAGVTFHDVIPAVRSGGRVGSAFEYASFARRATQLLRRDRERYDVVDVSGTTAWEHDVVRVHAVQRAVFRRWPSLGGATYRAARLRAGLGPLTYPRMGVAEAIERLQHRPGRYKRALAVTEEVARDLQDIHGVPEALVEVVPYAVDLRRFAAGGSGSLRADLGLARNALLLLFIGHDFRRKGLDMAIQALAGLPEDVHLVIVGDGDPQSYRTRALDSGLDGRVHFMGATTAPERLLCETDVFVLPTREDVWGIALIEAMAAGVPVVTTDAAGAASVVRSSGAGLIVPAGRVEELRAALAALLADPAKRRELGGRGSAAAARFGVDSFARSILSAYEHVLAEGR